MKVYFGILFLFVYSHTQAQEILNSKYNAKIISYAKMEIFICFPLKVKKSNGDIFKVLTSNYGLYSEYYSTTASTPEFADTLANILKREFVELNSYPTLIERAIDNPLYKHLTKRGVKKVLKKYFNTFVYEDKQFFKVKKKYASHSAMLTVLCFISEHNYFITSDNEGYYVVNLLE